MDGHIVSPHQVEAEVATHPAVLDAAAAYASASGEAVVRVLVAPAVQVDAVPLPTGVAWAVAVPMLLPTPTGKLRGRPR